MLCRAAFALPNQVIRNGQALITTDKYKSDEAYCNAYQLVPCYRFLIQQPSDKNQGESQNGALHNGNGTYLPAYLICINKADLQPYKGDSQNKGSPVCLAQLGYQAFSPAHRIIHYKAKGCAYQIGHRQRGKGIHPVGHRFGAYLIDYI